MSYEERPALRQVHVLEAVWSDLPEEVVDEVRRLWENMEYGNDHYYFNWTEEDYMDSFDEDIKEQYRYPLLAKYLREHGIENCLIHYWW